MFPQPSISYRFDEGGLDRKLTVMGHGVGGLVDDGCRRFNGEARPFLHGRAVYILLGMLFDHQSLPAVSFFRLVGQGVF